MKLTLFLTLILISVFSTKIHAQSVLVSEYLNEQPSGEWNEIIVVTDNLDMRGFVITDNNTNQVTRQGGVKFKNIEFWRHVRAGTIIGIWHRDYPSGSKQDRDTSLSDGRIMLAKLDTDFFEEYKSSAAIVAEAPFNVAIDGDIIEVLDAAGNHIHGLGHRVIDPAPGSYWVTMPEPKMNNAISLQNGQSNRAYPGAKLADYNGKHGDPITLACGTNVTRTLPNKDCNSGASNADFWHLLRIPTWLNPKLTTTVTANKVDLSWNNIIDVYPSDNIQGYIVLRDSGLTPTIPLDGTSYVVGQKISNAVVVAILPSLQTSYSDNISIPCGVIYTYRVYAYRYGIDDEFGNGADPKSTRGRQYNRDIYAFQSVIKQTVAGPKLQTQGSVTFCAGGNVEISVPSQPNLTAQWMYNGVDLPGETAFKITASQQGEYRLKLTDTQGCLLLSDSVVVTVNALPVCDVNPKTFNLCSDSTVVLVGTDNTDFTYQWQFNGTDVSGATQFRFIANKSGLYSISVKNKNGCTSSSPLVTIKTLQPTFTLSSSTLNFNSLTGCEVSKDDNSVSITNNGTEKIIIEKISEPSGFQLVSPSVPIELLPGQPVKLFLRFAPTTTGTSIGDMKFTINQCGASKQITLSGSSSGGGTPVALTSSVVNFKTLVTCGLDVRDTNFIEITALGSEDVTLLSRSISPENKTIDFLPSITFPYVIPAGQKRRLPIQFWPLADISYARDITLPYKTSSCSGDLKITTRGIRTTPTLEVHLDKPIDFGTLDSCTHLTKDTIIVVKNPSKVDLEIGQLISAQVQIIDPKPSPTITIPAGDSILLKIQYNQIGYDEIPKSTNLAFQILTPCSSNSELFTVTGNRSGAIITIPKQNFDLKEIVRCSSIPVLDSFDVNVGLLSYPYYNTTQLVDIVSSNPSITIDKGKFTWFDRNTTKSVSVLFTPNANAPLGAFKDSLRLIFEPCQRERIIYLTGKYVQSDIEVGPTFTKKDTSMVFDTIEVNTTSRQKFTIKNTGNVSMTTSSIVSGITDPFYIVGATPPLGSQLSVGDVMEIVVEYRPTNIGEQTSSGFVAITQPCSDAATITLKGNSKPPIIPPVPFHFVIDDTYRAQPGESIRIPIKMVGTGIQGKQLKQVKPTVLFNTTLLHVNSVSAGSALTGYTVSSTSVNNGSLKGLQLQADGTTITGEGEAFILNCEALLGNNLVTPLTIDSSSIGFVSTEVYPTKSDDGVFTLYGACNIAGRLVNVTGQVALQVASSNPVSDNSEVIFETVGEQHTKIAVYNNLGQQVHTLINQTVTSGVHSVNWNVNELAQGSYYIVLTSGMSQRTVRVEIQH